MLEKIQLTYNQLRSACLSYNHSFGFMTDEGQEKLLGQLRDWIHAINKEIQHSSRKEVLERRIRDFYENYSPHQREAAKGRIENHVKELKLIEKDIDKSTKSEPKKSRKYLDLTSIEDRIKINDFIKGFLEDKVFTITKKQDMTEHSRKLNKSFGLPETLGEHPSIKHDPETKIEMEYRDLISLIHAYMVEENKLKYTIHSCSETEHVKGGFTRSFPGHSNPPEIPKEVTIPEQGNIEPPTLAVVVPDVEKAVRESDLRKTIKSLTKQNTRLKKKLKKLKRAKSHVEMFDRSIAPKYYVTMLCKDSDGFEFLAFMDETTKVWRIRETGKPVKDSLNFKYCELPKGLKY